MFYPLDNKKKFHATGVCSSAALRYEGHDPRFARVEKGGLDPPFGIPLTSHIISQPPHLFTTCSA